MATDDISRSAYYRSKHYAGVRMQQGRVMTDDDFNEQDRIHHEDERRTRVDVIGACGSPDDGFRIQNVTREDGKVDFEILPGTFYLGGLRLDLETPGLPGGSVVLLREPTAEGSGFPRFSLQDNWLRNPGINSPPDAEERWDMVYLEAWQQSVSAVEDNEVYEVALGGPDTSARVRTMYRVRVFPGVKSSFAVGPNTGRCEDNWNWLTSFLFQEGRVGYLNSEYELISDVRLKVEFDTSEAVEDLCAPEAAGGYLGAENQSIRVEVVSVEPRKITWGFDNGAPLYRVEISEGGTRVEMLTPPKDQHHWPRSDQVVEVLPLGAVLPNGEKLAEEVEPGHFSMVAASYDPDQRTFTLKEPVPDDFEGATHLYLRVWDRGSDPGEETTIEVASEPVALGNTGLTVSLLGNHLGFGRYWVIAARPQTPNRVVPWELESDEGRPPDGVRRFYAPLALVHWLPDGGAPEIQDCRKTFRPLTEQGTCCTYTVGDGVHSHGDFRSLQAAIDQLPPEGGEICVLAGEYDEHVKIEGRRCIKIRGCGKRSVLRPKDGTREPALRIADSLEIAVCSLAIYATEGVGIELESTVRHFEVHGEITLSDLDVSTRDYGGVVGVGGTGITVCDSRVEVRRLETSLADDARIGRQAAVYLAGSSLVIEGNQIVAAEFAPSQYTALGGLQIGGPSHDVLIRGNRIQGFSAGHGITLGSYSYQPLEVFANFEQLVTFFSINQAHHLGQGSSRIVGDGLLIQDLEPSPIDPLERPVSDGPVSDVRIVDNDVRFMGGNGISVVRFFDFSREAATIEVSRLTLERNRIRDCLQLETAEATETMGRYGAFAGIALARCDGVVLRQNEIVGNAKTHRRPVCGVFILEVEGLTVEGNEIVDNGLRSRRNEPSATDTPRGGVVIRKAQTGGFHDGTPAARIVDNVISANEGRALDVAAVGPVLVHGNQLTAFASYRPQLPVVGYWRVAEPFPDFADFGELLGGATVSIVNQGCSQENFLPPGVNFGWPYLNLGWFFCLQPRGLIQFHDNQVIFEGRGTDATAVRSSMLLVAPHGDISASDNQCVCRFPQLSSATHRVERHAYVHGYSVRVTGNLFNEGHSNAELSAYTDGVFNTTADNQGTHCIFVTGTPKWKVDRDNRVLVEISSPRCEELDDPIFVMDGELDLALSTTATF